MKAIGGLLRRGRFGEQKEFAAVFVVGAVNGALSAVLRLGPADARAISFQRGEVVVGVSHGAVAGSVQQRAADIIGQANKKIAHAGGGNTTVKRIITRPQQQPLP